MQPNNILLLPNARPEAVVDPDAGPFPWSIP